MNHPLLVRIKVAKKRKARKKWQMSRHPDNKRKLNKLTRELTNLLHITANEHVQEYLQSLSPRKEDNFSLWKITKKLKRPTNDILPIKMKATNWSEMIKKKKTETFANHLSTIFRLNDTNARQRLQRHY